MAPESIHDMIARIITRIAPDPNRRIFVHACKLFDQVGLLSVKYTKQDDCYEIDYEDNRGDPRTIFITRKDIKDANL